MDLNNDGYTDCLSGRYFPNDITWFKGSEKGFTKGEIIEEKDRVKIDMTAKFIKAPKGRYNKGTPVFVDIDNDKDYDFFLCDHDYVFFNRNIGTPKNPVFGKREYVTTVKRDTITFANPTLAVYDWDRDGILDLVVSNSSNKKDDVVLSFYKGLGNNKYESAKTILKNSKTKKCIPGGSYWIYPTDWNNDGTIDLLVGSAVYYKNEKFHKELNTIPDFFSKLKKEKTKEERKKYFEGIKIYGHVYILYGKRK